MKESDLYLPLRNWLKNQGYEVRPEVCIFYRTFDVVALKDDICIALEMKKALTKQLFHQIRSGDMFADYSYAVVGTKPRKIELFVKHGIGILSIKNGVVTEINKPTNHKSFIQHYRDFILKYFKTYPEEGIGGQPNLKGIGPAQDVERAIGKYRVEHPNATWKELYNTIPNHYCNYRSMQGAMHMIQLRRVWNKHTVKQLTKKEKG